MNYFVFVAFLIFDICLTCCVKKKLYWNFLWWGELRFFEMIKWIERKREAYNTGYSQAVSHPSTNPARQGLTSVIGREPVYSLWYGRRQVICRENLLFYKGKVKKRPEEPPCGFVLLPSTQMPCSAGGCGCLLSVRPSVHPLYK